MDCELTGRRLWCLLLRIVEALKVVQLLGSPGDQTTHMKPGIELFCSEG